MTLLALSLRVLVVSLTLAAPKALLAEDATRFRSILEETPILGGPSSEELHKRRDTLDDIKRQNETSQVVKLLRGDQEEWRQSAQKFDEELRGVIALAQRDEKIRAIAHFFRVFGELASLAALALADKSPGKSLDSSPPHRVIEVCEGGTCQPVEIQQIKMESIINEAITPLGGADDSVIRQIRGSLDQAAATLPSLLCDLGGERCVPLDALGVTQTAASPGLSSSGIRITPGKPIEIDIGPARIIETPSPSLEEQKSLFKKAKPLLSFVLDAAPGVSGGKALVEVITGKDPITDEQVSRIAAGSGIIFGMVPGGKVISKGIGKAVSKGVASKSHRFAGQKVSEILRQKRGDIMKAKLPKGSPRWEEVRGMTWEQINKGAGDNRPGFKTIRKLLSDRRFDQ